MCSAIITRTIKSERFLGCRGSNNWDTISCVWGTVNTTNSKSSALITAFANYLSKQHTLKPFLASQESCVAHQFRWASVRTSSSLSQHYHCHFPPLVLCYSVGVQCAFPGGLLLWKPPRKMHSSGTEVEYVEHPFKWDALGWTCPGWSSNVIRLAFTTYLSAQRGIHGLLTTRYKIL